MSNIYLCIFECAIEKQYTKISGDNNEEEIPVPMPNTEVKLLSAEDTYELPCWENRKSPDFFMPFYSLGSKLENLVMFETVKGTMKMSRF